MNSLYDYRSPHAATQKFPQRKFHQRSLDQIFPLVAVRPKTFSGLIFVRLPLSDRGLFQIRANTCNTANFQV